MECSVCRIRGPVGFCAVCRQLLCEECGVECMTCGRLVCPAHRHNERRGEYICQECAAVTPGRAQEPPAAAPPPHKSSASEVLSFDQLTADMGATAFHIPDAMSHSEREKETPPDPALAGKPLRRAPSNDPNEFRILTASSPKGTPIWLSGLFTGGMACVLLMPLFKQSGFVDFQPWYSYAVMLMAFSAILWTGYGLSRQTGKGNERWLCLIGLILGLAAFVVAFVLRYPDIRM